MFSFVKRVILLAVFNRKSVFCSNTISKQEVNLSNEICKTIPILVETDFIVHIFFPYALTLMAFRGFDNLPLIKKCMKQTCDRVELNVFNKLLFEKQIISLENHTNCKS